MVQFLTTNYRFLLQNRYFMCQQNAFSSLCNGKSLEFIRFIQSAQNRDTVP